MTRAIPEAAIRPANTEDAEAASTVLAEAFLPGPVADWLIPDVQIRRDVYLRCFRIVVDHALDVGQLYVTQDLAGVAVWFPMSGGPQEPGDFERRIAAAAGQWMNRYILKAAASDPHHPTVAHHHLAYLGVLPERQGAGLGSALLNHHHAHLDSMGVPAYLEASNSRNRDLYLRHGYTTPGPFWLPEEGPPLWAMWREPARSIG